MTVMRDIIKNSFKNAGVDLHVLTDETLRVIEGFLFPPHRNAKQSEDWENVLFKQTEKIKKMLDSLELSDDDYWKENASKSPASRLLDATRYDDGWHSPRNKWNIQELLSLRGLDPISERETRLLFEAWHGSVPTVVIRTISTLSDAHYMSSRYCDLLVKSRLDGIDFIPQQENKKTNPVLLSLAYSGCANLIELGLSKSKKSDIDDAKSINGVTPVWRCASRGSEPALRLFLEKGADPNVAGKDGETPFVAACRHRNVSCVKTLVDFGVKYSKDDVSIYADMLEFKYAASKKVPEKALKLLFQLYGASEDEIKKLNFKNLPAKDIKGYSKSYLESFKLLKYTDIQNVCNDKKVNKSIL